MRRRICGAAIVRGAAALALAGAAILAADAMAAATAQAAAGQSAQSTPSTQPPWSGDRTTPVHLFQLRDELDQLIVPTAPAAPPFSARYTCGPCHDYDTVRGGWHFNAPAGGPGGRPGQPWFEVDDKTGTVLPLSYRGWPGTWDPRRAGLSDWAFTLLFGRHMPGGGPAEPGPETVMAPDSRWNVSGTVEANCLACHNGSRRQDASEWAKQIARHNLRWAATAASGLGEVGGMASRLRETWDVYDGPNPDDHEWAVAPSVKYDAGEFDHRHRVYMDLKHVPDNERCLACHSASPAGQAHWAADSDVHTAAGLRCADCHRNDLGHAIIRGYEGEAEEIGKPEAAAFTCRGCHLGEKASGEKTISPGRLGAPYPRHPGLPVVHLERLTCTACHSGSRPAGGLTRVRTSRANRLGIHGAAQWWTDTPAIAEPVFARDARGRLGPRRLAWPALWVKIEGDETVPLQPESVLAAADGVLNGEERLAAVLSSLALACEAGEEPALAAGGFVFTLDVDGGLAAEPASPGTVPEGLSWGLRKEGRILPLLPAFDPDDPEKDPGIEPRLQKFLEALAVVPGSPGAGAFVIKNTLYRLSDGYLNAGPVPETAAGSAPQGFSWLRDEKLIPLADDYDLRTAAAKAGREQTLTEEQVALVLRALAEADAGGESDSAAADGSGNGDAPGAESTKDYGYISGGRLFRLNAAGGLKAQSHPAAEAVTWPLAHDVRPAQASLGFNGCGDCHSAGSDFFFTRVEGTGPLLTNTVERRSAHGFMRLSGLFQRLFGLTFTVRPALKAVLLASAFLVGALLLLAFLVFLGRVSGLQRNR